MSTPWLKAPCRLATHNILQRAHLPPPSALLWPAARPSSSSSSSRWKQRQGKDAFARDAKVQGLKSRAAFKLLEMDAKYRLFKRGQVVVDLGFAPGSWSQVAVERTKPSGRVLGIDLIPAQPPRGVSTIQGNFLSPSVHALVKQCLLLDEEARQTAKRDARAGEAGAKGDESGVVGGDEADDRIVERPSYIDMERQAAHAEDSALAEGDITPTETTAGNVERRLVDIVLSDMSEPWPQTHGFSINSVSNPYRRMMNTSGISFKDHVGSMELCTAALTFASDTLKGGGHFVCKFYQGPEDKAFENLLRKMFVKVHREKPESSRSESRENFFVALKRRDGVTLADAESS